ncbi:hypothetical protein C5B85_14400 [Pseudoclavibacter sp. AY1F1]|uniref:hypothetical protein n=1 Tax=Pseudoclavibacter sp. AY1F1 TaxID=2080583 RepID=UPI000CE78DD5|nr:hypothetical protein [Pseudoclavibacter sp. AY1F1]PPF43143.1 hypothetical protein C5B85_14400 [Pseudoclavibacter sp. AY1F1]
MHELRLSPETQRRAIALNMRQSWISLAMLAPILLVLVVIFSLQDFWLGFGYGMLVVLLIGGSVPLSIWLARKSMRETYIRFGDGWIEHRWMFRTRRFSAAEATSVVTVDQMTLGGFMGAPTHHLIVTGGDRRLLILVGQMWTQQQLTAVMQDLASRGVPWISVPEPITPPQLRARDPRLVPWWQAHPVAFALLIAGATFAVVIVLAIVVAFAIFTATTS